MVAWPVSPGITVTVLRAAQGQKDTDWWAIAGVAAPQVRPAVAVVTSSFDEGYGRIPNLALKRTAAVPRIARVRSTERESLGSTD
ncbi:MAG: hypothetical protein KJ749_07390 [Planctomycetes bacterium]|nr:hypothetical protein [Planctomycetota bacterium]